MLSLLYSFSSRFLKASFSSFCCLQQLALEPKSVASHSSSLSFSLLSVITKVLWKCKPLLGSEVFFDEVFFLAGVSFVWQVVHGVAWMHWLSVSCRSFICVVSWCCWTIWLGTCIYSCWSFNCFWSWCCGVSRWLMVCLVIRMWWWRQGLVGWWSQMCWRSVCSVKWFRSEGSV